MPNALRVVLATLIVLCCVPARFDGATVTAPDKGSVRVGLLDTHSGYYEPEGEDVDAGFRYFLATHDDELGGFRVELRTADENEYGALASARQLVQVDMVDAIVGLVRSSDALLVASYLAERKTPLVIAGAGADALTQSEAQKNFIRVAHTSSQDDMPLGRDRGHVRRGSAKVAWADRVTFELPARIQNSRMVDKLLIVV